MDIVENRLLIKIIRLKVTSLYNVVDDILRNYEVFDSIRKKD
jgi:hypothetical protein